MEGLERLHQRFLDEILRLGPVAREPHGMAKQAIDMRHRFCFEREPAAIGFGVSAHRPYSAIGSQSPNHAKASLYSIRRGAIFRAIQPRL